MIYSKLEVILLSVVAQQSPDSIDSLLASYILEHVAELDDLTISGLASACHVGTGSVSRFCRSIGLADFFELRRIVQEHNAQYREKKMENPASPQQIAEALEAVDRSISKKQLEKLANDLKQYPKIAAFGLLKGQAACLAFAQEMLMHGKVVNTNLSLFGQIDHFKKADENDLILLFSYTASYFDYVDVRALRPYLKKPKIWMICGEKKELDDVNEWLVFESRGIAQEHPYQLIRAGELVGKRLNQNIAVRSRNTGSISEKV